MKTCKKLFSLLLVAVMLVAAIPFASFADETGGESANATMMLPITKLSVYVDNNLDKEATLGNYSREYHGTNPEIFTGPDAKTEGEFLLQKAGLGATYSTGFNYKQTAVNYMNGTASVELEKVAAPVVPATKDFTVQVKIGADKSTAQNGKTGTYNADATLATPDVNDGTKAFAILDASVPGAYPQADYKFEAASVKGNTIYIRVSEKVVTPPAPGHSHSWKAIQTGATDTQHVEVCDCGDSKMVDHTWDVTGAVAPTHTTVGKDADRKCKVCGYEIKGKELSKLPEHTFVNGVCACNAKQYTINYKLDGTDVSKTYIDEAGNADMSSAQKVLEKLGMTPSAYNTSNFNKTDYNISFTATTIPTSYTYTTLLLTFGGKTETVTINYTKEGTVSNADIPAILTAAKKSYEPTKYNYSVSVGTDNKTLTIVQTTIGKYTVNCIVNGQKFASKTDVPYYGDFNDAAAILKAADITVTTSYQKSAVTVSGNVITVDLYTEIVVKVYNNANSYSDVTMRVGQPYVNYLGTNLINNSTFGGITVKDTSDRNTYYSASQVNGGTALVSAFDKEITIQRNGDSCTLYFLRSDGTVLESRKLYAGDQIGTLPSYIVGNVPAVWTYNGKPISATDVYNFKTTSVNIVPYFGGISDVYVDVYTNGNVKTMQTRVKVTDLVQNGVLYLNSEVKSAISSALRNTSNKNLTYTAFFDASTWSDFIKTKNTNGAAEPIRVGDNSERQGAVYLYVMVNNVTQKATDSTNPKTGDDVKLGVAAAVLAVAVVGFGAAIVIKKKKGVQ